MRLDINYRTIFEYDALVRESQNELRAAPTTDDHQQLLGYRVTTSPSARTISYTDYWGTRVDHFGIHEPHVSLEVIAEAAVETRAVAPVTVKPAMAELLEPRFRDRTGEYLRPTRHTNWGSLIENEAARLVDMNQGDLVAAIRTIHEFVNERLAYEPGSTEIGQPVQEIMANGKGVCQDYAHLAVSLCRSAGIPARYTSGYLFTTDDRTGVSATEKATVLTHAWFEAAVPGHGWLALDPTNGLDVGLQHVKIGHGRDYDDVPPLRGAYSGTGQPEVEALVEMRRMDPTRHPSPVIRPSAPRPFEPRMSQEQQQQ